MPKKPKSVVKSFEFEIPRDPRRVTEGDTSSGRTALGDAVNDFRDAEKAPKTDSPD